MILWGLNVGMMIILVLSPNVMAMELFVFYSSFVFFLVFISSVRAVVIENKKD